jgi:hypothetical protein
MEPGRATKISESKIDGASQCGTQISRKPAAGLQGNFKKDGKRHGSLARGREIPFLVGHIILGFNPCAGGGCEDKGLVAFNAGYPIEELVRGARKSGDASLTVKDPVRLAKGFGGVSFGEGYDLLVGVERFLGTKGDRPSAQGLDRAGARVGWNPIGSRLTIKVRWCSGDLLPELLNLG